MKKSLIPSLLLLSALSANAQVDNYSLRLAQGATVKCGLMTEMNSLSEYTVQLWLNPTKWTKGATLLSVGDNIEIKLDAEGTIKAKLGSAEATITNADLKAGSWNRLQSLSRTDSAQRLSTALTLARQRATMPCLPIAAS